MLAELYTLPFLPSSHQKKLKVNCFVSSVFLKLETTSQFVKNIKMINLSFFYIIRTALFKINAYKHLLTERH